MVYVHYGFMVFEPTLFVPVRNCPWKPKPDDDTGLWASREGDPLGWKAWCEHSGFTHYDEDDCFRFKLASGAKVLELNSPDQLEVLPKATTPPELERFFSTLQSDWVMLDYERLSAEGYDAIELTNCLALKRQLAVWDCNSLFVMNPEVIVEVEPGNNNSKFQT